MKDILSGKIASIPRNKQIASVFKEAGIIEKYGSGIRRVVQTFKDSGAPVPVFESIADFFKVTLFPIKEVNTGGVSGGVSGGISGGVNELLDFIKENPGKNSREIQKQSGISKRTLERQLAKLRSEEKIEFRGAPKTGGYFAI